MTRFKEGFVALVLAFSVLLQPVRGEAPNPAQFAQFLNEITQIFTIFTLVTDLRDVFQPILNKLPVELVQLISVQDYTGIGNYMATRMSRCQLVELIIGIKNDLKNINWGQVKARLRTLNLLTAQRERLIDAVDVQVNSPNWSYIEGFLVDTTPYGNYCSSGYVNFVKVESIAEACGTPTCSSGGASKMRPMSGVFADCLIFKIQANGGPVSVNTDDTSAAFPSGCSSESMHCTINEIRFDTAENPISVNFTATGFSSKIQKYEIRQGNQALVSRSRPFSYRGSTLTLNHGVSGRNGMGDISVVLSGPTSNGITPQFTCRQSDRPNCLESGTPSFGAMSRNPALALNAPGVSQWTATNTVCKGENWAIFGKVPSTIPAPSRVQLIRDGNNTNETLSTQVCRYRSANEICKPSQALPPVPRGTNNGDAVNYSLLLQWRSRLYPNRMDSCTYAVTALPDRACEPLPPVECRVDVTERPGSGGQMSYDVNVVSFSSNSSVNARGLFKARMWSTALNFQKSMASYEWGSLNWGKTYSGSTTGLTSLTFEAEAYNASDVGPTRCQPKTIQVGRNACQISRMPAGDHWFNGIYHLNSQFQRGTGSNVSPRRLDIFFMSNNTSLNTRSSYANPPNVLETPTTMLPWPANGLQYSGQFTAKYYDSANRLITECATPVFQVFPLEPKMCKVKWNKSEYRPGEVPGTTITLFDEYGRVMTYGYAMTASMKYPNYSVEVKPFNGFYQAPSTPWKAIPQTYIAPNNVLSLSVGFQNTSGQMTSLPCGSAQVIFPKPSPSPIPNPSPSPKP